MMTRAPPHEKLELEREDELSALAWDRVLLIEIDCPGVAHALGEACVICDEERDGTIDVYLTYVERDALCGVALGKRVDANFLPRLARLGLVEAVGDRVVPTRKGLAIVDREARTLS